MLWFSQIGVHSGYWTHLFPAELVMAFGMGMVFVPVNNTALVGVAPSDAGVASALINTTQQVGGSIGTALLNTIATTATATYLHAHGIVGSVAVGCRRWRRGGDGDRRDRPRLRGGVRAWPAAILGLALVVVATFINAPAGSGGTHRTRREEPVTGDAGELSHAVAAGPRAPARCPPWAVAGRRPRRAGLSWRSRGRPAWAAGRTRRTPSPPGATLAMCSPPSSTTRSSAALIPAGVALALERVVRAAPRRRGADRRGPGAACRRSSPSPRPAPGWPGSAPPIRPPWTSWPTWTPAWSTCADRRPRARSSPADRRPTRTPTAAGLARAKRLEMLRIAARDLLGLDRRRSRSAPSCPAGLRSPAAGLGTDPSHRASTSDRARRTGRDRHGQARRRRAQLLQRRRPPPRRTQPPAAGRSPSPAPSSSWPAAPGGSTSICAPKAGPARWPAPCASYRAYWDRWADTWEFQALLKARAVAGDPDLGAASKREAAARVWGRPFGADELRQVRQLKARAEQAVTRQGLADRELKRGKGGIRDIEFAVQLLQLVHGRADPGPALPVNAAGACAPWPPAATSARRTPPTLEAAYSFLRTVEHRLQLYEDRAGPHRARTQRGRPDPAGPGARLPGPGRGHRAGAVRSGPAPPSARGARWIHERLFFRPLLESFTAEPARQARHHRCRPKRSPTACGPSASQTPSARPRRSDELTRGFSRSSQLMTQMLPMLLDWLSHARLTRTSGLLGLRTLATGHPPPRPARPPCAGSHPRRPASCASCSVPGLGSPGPSSANPTCSPGWPPATPWLTGPAPNWTNGPTGSLAWRSGEGAVERGLRLLRRGRRRCASRPATCSDLADVDATGVALTDLAESVVDAALRLVGSSPAVRGHRHGPPRRARAGLHQRPRPALRLRGPAGLSPARPPPRPKRPPAPWCASSGGATPATGLYRVDTALRPEGRQGPQARSLEAYAAYYQRWAQVWERQALLRGRIIAGDADLGDRFAALAGRVRVGPADRARRVREIRRTKARIERERVPASEDPKFHLKLGPGSLSDIEWTAQLLQLHHGVRADRHRGGPRRACSGRRPRRLTTSGCSSTPTASASAPATGWAWCGTAPPIPCRPPAPS